MLQLLRHTVTSSIVFLAKAIHDTSSFTPGWGSNTLWAGLGSGRDVGACTMGVDRVGYRV